MFAKCKTCPYLNEADRDLLDSSGTMRAAAAQMKKLCAQRFRGTVEFHFDGSGHIRKSKTIQFAPIIPLL